MSSSDSRDSENFPISGFEDEETYGQFYEKYSNSENSGVESDDSDRENDYDQFQESSHDEASSDISIQSELVDGNSNTFEESSMDWEASEECAGKSQTSNYVSSDDDAGASSEAQTNEEMGSYQSEQTNTRLENKKLKEGKIKWTFLEHKGPLFPAAYSRLPENLFRYDGEIYELSDRAEEVAYYYAVLLKRACTTKKVFNDNFFSDWRSVMEDDEKNHIRQFKKCDFREMFNYFENQKKNMTAEEKATKKAYREKIREEYGFCTIDGKREEIQNMKIEPPGLFLGRGDHPKMGKLKPRVYPEDVIINCSEDSKIPKPPPGHKWKKEQSDNSVQWLASWKKNVQGMTKYILLSPSSTLKGTNDRKKYEIARELHKHIDKIRKNYRAEWENYNMKVRQRAVALYIIDRLALRVGNEKDEDEADTVGCCSLRVEHIALHEKLNGKPYVVVFNFLGKDSVQYDKEVSVEKPVFDNLALFIESKEGTEDVFDKLTPQLLNDYLKDQMPGLTSKVFRTYNACVTMQKRLQDLTDTSDSVEDKVHAYQRANRDVAKLCNHVQSVNMGQLKAAKKLREKIQSLKLIVEGAEFDLEQAKTELELNEDSDNVKEYVKKFNNRKNDLQRKKERLQKWENQAKSGQVKLIALISSKLNYIDPRIIVAWCKKHKVPIGKIYSKQQRKKFQWAIKTTEADFVFEKW